MTFLRRRDAETQRQRGEDIDKCALRNLSVSASQRRKDFLP